MRWVLTHQISNIARKHSNILSYSKFIDKDNMNWLIHNSNYNRKHLSNLGVNDEIIYMHFHADFFNQPLNLSNPNELFAVFESFLFLKEQTLEYNIAAITCGHVTGVWYITITKDDFERLYNSLDVKSDKRSEVAKQLAEIWAEENFYNRSRLILDEQNEYRQNLATIWNNFVISHDGKFFLTYNQSIEFKFDVPRSNRVSIWEALHPDWAERPGRTIIPGKRNLMDLPIEETGFAYACWDEYNNIWGYGETTGLTFLKYDGDKNWEFAEVRDEVIPYPIQKVIEVKNS